MYIFGADLCTTKGKSKQEMSLKKTISEVFKMHCANFNPEYRVTIFVIPMIGIKTINEYWINSTFGLVVHNTLMLTRLENIQSRA